MVYSSIFLTVYEHARRAVPWGAGFHGLCSVPYMQASCNLEMQILEDSFKINFSNSASLTGASADITRLSGLVIWGLAKHCIGMKGALSES